MTIKMFNKVKKNFTYDEIPTKISITHTGTINIWTILITTIPTNNMLKMTTMFTFATLNITVSFIVKKFKMTDLTFSILKLWLLVWLLDEFLLTEVYQGQKRSLAAAAEGVG